MTSSKLTFWASLWLISVCTAPVPGHGAPPAAPAGIPRRADALPRPDSPPKVGADSRLEEILREWEIASSKFRRLESKFSLIKYDPIFEVEQRGAGSLAVNTDGRAYYEVTPATINRKERSQKVGKDGNRFILQSVEHERWHWTRKSVIKVNEKERTFEEYALRRESEDSDYHPDPPALPDDDEASNEDLAFAEETAPSTADDLERHDTKRPTFLEAVIGYVIVMAIVLPNLESGFAALSESFETFWLARPFLLGMEIGELKQRFDVTLLKETAAEVRLQFTPINKDRCHFDRAVLVLSINDYRPIALKLIDPTGAATVHVFTDVQINSRSGFADPFNRPNLKGYREINGQVSK